MPDGTEDRINRLETAFETVLPHLATKADLANFETVLPHLATKADLANFETALPHLATKADLARLETDLVKAIGKLESKMMWGALGLLVGMATIAVKLFT